MNSDQQHSKLQELLGRMADDRPSPEDAAQIESLLLESSALREAYLDWIALHVHLEQSHALNQHDVDEALLGSDDARPGLVRRLFKRSHEFLAQATPLSMLVAAAVIGVVLSVMALTMPPLNRAMTQRREKPREIAARLTGTHEAVWGEKNSNIERGRSLLQGNSIELISGLAELTFRNGAVVTLQGPARFQVDTRSAGTLHQGRLFAHVNSKAVGFQIRTPVTEITDLGTEFGVMVTRRANSIVADIEVITGKVECRGFSSVGMPVQVLAGQRYVQTATEAHFAASAAGRFVTFCPNALAPKDSVAFTNFNGATVEGNTLRGVTWRSIGVRSPGDISIIDEHNPAATATFFRTPTTIDRLAPEINLHLRGPWSFSIPIEPVDDDIELTGVRFEYLQIRNSGEPQVGPRDTNYQLILTGSKSGQLGIANSMNRNDLTGVVVLHFPEPIRVSHNEQFQLKLIVGGDGLGTHSSLDNFAVNGRVLPKTALNH